MFCAKLTLIDRRFSNNGQSPVDRLNKPKHATKFKRNCLTKESNQSVLLDPDEDSSAGADHGGDEGESTQTTTVFGSFNWTHEREEDTERTRRQTEEEETSSTPPPALTQRTPLSLWTLELEWQNTGDKTGNYGDNEASATQETQNSQMITTGRHTARPFRVPYNYRQYQKTILSRPFLAFTESPCSSSLGSPGTCARDRDRNQVICVRGEKIEQPSSSEEGAEEGDPKAGRTVDGDDPDEVKVVKGQRRRGKESIEDDYFQLMNEQGETNMNFYEFRKTFWDLDGENDAGGSGGRGRREESEGRDELFRRKQKQKFPSIRPPSPNTKQVIRVNVVRMASS